MQLNYYNRWKRIKKQLKPYVVMFQIKEEIKCREFSECNEKIQLCDHISKQWVYFLSVYFLQINYFSVKLLET